MPPLTRLYTRAGDKGTTRLGGGQKVPKNSLRLECYGTMDELNSNLGLVVALGAAAGLFPGWMQPREADADLNARVAARLQAARDAYARGVDALEGALEALGVSPS